MSLCAPERTGEKFLGVLELSLEAVSQQSPHGRQSQARLPGIRGNGSLSAVSHQEKWPELIPRAVSARGLETFQVHLQDALCPTSVAFSWKSGTSGLSLSSLMGSLRLEGSDAAGGL